MIFGFGKKGGNDGGREHQRFQASTEKVRIYGEEFPLGDLSLGGMAVNDYKDDATKVNQYFEFVIEVQKDGQTEEYRGHAQVARVGDDFMGCKFTKPQPELEFSVSRYLEYMETLAAQ